MIELHTWTTPNGYKPLILLEELGMPYTVRAVDLGKGAQHDPDYLRINPNGKIPTLVDPDAEGGPVSVFESGAILIYLAEKGGQFLAPRGQARADAIAWTMFQLSAVGPMLGQAHHFVSQAPEKIPYAIERFTGEVARIVGVLDGRLAQVEYLAGEYSIADMANWPWLKGLGRFGYDLGKYPALRRWIDAVDARPAVTRAMAWKP